ncbi:MAG: hydroxyacylglutathione hydrolase [Candidatus Muproteobacteria bacterium RBG_16_65_34]|uniref:Hydroxyacylglutathione hydrolase n=1 Tax=Candidatus Muproteobacteria bacterium RBG_16_65_34 TaxID=1817760 RepID=A0A1F6TMQ8_9PROT|nr:MAG: hydroxyacylglutathione hydrolase [Candidatus Muproteobacteria bacterium RBG_16_65_34]
MTPVLHVPAFEDNYIWLIRGAPGQVAIVDPGDAGPVLDFLARERLTPAAILCTHHHGDHVGGVQDLLRRHAIPVYGPARERIPGLTHPLAEGDRVRLPELALEFAVLDVPGHTHGHIAYYGAGMLFCGDTLFSAGCGRLFEGTAEEMYRSLTKLAALPPDTLVYCAHEYTAANLRFAIAVEPDNAEIRAYQREISERRARGEPSLPSTIGRERRINPFLRAAEASVRRAAERHGGRRLAENVNVFAELRRWKDDFRG